VADGAVPRRSRRDVTVHAPPHGQGLIHRLDDPDLPDVSVAAGAIHAGGNVTHVRKLHMVRHLVDPVPGNGLACIPVLPEAIDLFWVLAPWHKRMASHACGHRRDARVHGPLGREVTVLAVNLELGGVPIMGKCDRLARTRIRRVSGNLRPCFPQDRSEGRTGNDIVLGNCTETVESRRQDRQCKDRKPSRQGKGPVLLHVDSVPVRRRNNPRRPCARDPRTPREAWKTGPEVRRLGPDRQRGHVGLESITRRCCLVASPRDTFPAMSRTAPNADLPPPWGRHSIPEIGEKSLRIGPRRLRMIFREGEIRIAAEDEFSPSPPDARWTRWVTPGGEREVMLQPVLPDRAIVLEPEQPFHLLPRASARIYVRVPLWIRIQLPLAETTAANLLLEEIPTVSLSDTWWGSMAEGELAYWLTTTARREMRPELFRPHLAACPLVVTNGAATDLRVEKLSLRVAHLSLFARGGELWSDECRVSWQGEGEESRVDVSGQSPAEAPNAERVAAPRNPVQRGLRARTFGRLASLSGLGGLG